MTHDGIVCLPGERHDVGVVGFVPCHTPLQISPSFLTLFANLILNRLVLETLEPLSEDRKCFRLINGVLVERTVKDVVPALKTNQEGLRKVLEDLVKQYKTKQDDLEKWKVSWSSLGPSRASLGEHMLTHNVQKKHNVQVVQQ